MSLLVFLWRGRIRTLTLSLMNKLIKWLLECTSKTNADMCFSLNNKKALCFSLHICFYICQPVSIYSNVHFLIYELGKMSRRGWKIARTEVSWPSDRIQMLLDTHSSIGLIPFNKDGLSTLPKSWALTKNERVSVRVRVRVRVRVWDSWVLTENICMRGVCKHSVCGHYTWEHCLCVRSVCVREECECECECEKCVCEREKCVCMGVCEEWVCVCVNYDWEGEIELGSVSQLR